MNNIVSYPETHSKVKDNLIKNKLVVISGICKGREFELLQRQTTIGNAPHNDVALEEKDISGFHAEFRMVQDECFISDFSSEKGTFVNGRKVTNEAQVMAGDRIKIGSMETIFVPSNAVIVKKSTVEPHSDKISKNFFSATQKKWLWTACAIILTVSLIKIMAAREEDGQLRKIRDDLSIASNQEIVTNLGGEKKNDFKAAHENQTDTKGDGPPAADGQGQIKPNVDPLDEIATICFRIAKKFADYQLWHEALAYYHKVSQRDSDYPGLSEQMDKMQFEIDNQSAYQQGLSLIKLGRYKQGIELLKSIPEKSTYYLKTIKEIDAAEKKIASA